MKGSKSITPEIAEEIKKALGDGDAITLTRLADAYDIKQVALKVLFDSEPNEEKNKCIWFIPSPFDTIKELFFSILREEQEAKDINTILDALSWDNEKWYIFLSSPSEIIIQEIAKLSLDFSSEILAVTRKFLLKLKEKLEEKIKSQIKIVQFFIGAGGADPNVLLVEAFRQLNIQLAKYLIEEQKADFNAHTKQFSNSNREPYWVNPVNEFVEDATQYSLIAKEFLSLLFLNGFNPDRRLGFKAQENTDVPWLPFLTRLAVEQSLDRCGTEIYKDLYELTSTYGVNFKKRLAFCMGLYHPTNNRSCLQSLSFGRNELFEKRIVGLIFTLAGFGLNTKIKNCGDDIDVKPLYRFTENKYTLLSQEIKEYNHGVRQQVHQAIPLMGGKANITTIIFQYAGVNKSAHNQVAACLEAWSDSATLNFPQSFQRF